jgi:hypothetical protein
MPEFSVGETVAHQVHGQGVVHHAFVISGRQFYDVDFVSAGVREISEQFLSHAVRATNVVSRDDENVTMHYKGIEVPSRVSTHWNSSWGELWREGVNNAIDHNVTVVENNEGLQCLRDADGDTWFELEAGKWTISGFNGDSTREDAKQRRYEAGSGDWLVDQPYSEIVAEFGPIEWVGKQ